MNAKHDQCTECYSCAKRQLAGGRLVANNTAVKRLRVCNCCSDEVACSLVASIDLKNKKTHKLDHCLIDRKPMIEQALC